MNSKALECLEMIFFQSVDRCREGGPRDAKEDVHPPGQPHNGGAVDAEGGLLPQAQADQQHLRQARPGELIPLLLKTAAR